ncbi:MAG: 50S ribosomal protein L25 [Sedimentisphaerales bacterium]|nr:50S ribosomal protein L25 [Sedimentisphaerales bacterium]
MVETIVLKAEKREQAGSRYSRKLRKQGLVPAIIYGHKTEPVAIQLNYHDLALELQHHHRLLDVELDGAQEKLLVKDVQHDYLGDKVIHVDLTRVNIDERVQVTVEVELRGTPVGVSEGGVLDQINTDIELECLVTAIPESVRALVSDLKIGETLVAGDLELPAGAKLISDPTTAIATVSVVAEEAEEAEEAEVAEGEVEPEIIAKKAEEAGQGESEK